MYKLEGILSTLMTPFTDDGKAVEEFIIIADVFVHSTAVGRQRVYISNYKAVGHAVRKAMENRPRIDELIENKDRLRHPFKCIS